MKYIEEFRDKKIVKDLVNRIRQKANGQKLVKIMEVCGTHTMSIARFGIRRLIPDNVELISGPGCPVCVTPNRYLDQAIAIGRLQDVILTTFGDMIRVPGSTSSLEREKTSGRDIRIVYSTVDALTIARKNPDKEVVFLGVGFETTVPTIASSLVMAKKEGLTNYTVLCAHKTMPKPMEVLAGTDDVQLNGFICPAHVTAITGAKIYQFLVDRYKKSCVVAGFEPVDILQGIYLLLKQIWDNSPQVANQYSRVATWEGNLQAQKIISEVMDICDAEWRGIGWIPGSGLAINDKYRDFDAAKRFTVEIEATRENPGCICGQVMKGINKPTDCKLFGKVCNPENPIGACMVSSEGTCAAYYRYDRFEDFH